MANAKKLTTGEQNLLKKFKLDTFSPTEPATFERSNVFTGSPSKLNTLGIRIFDLVISMQMAYDRGTKINIQDFDRLRHLFLKLFPDEYMNLLD